MGHRIVYCRTARRRELHLDMRGSAAEAEIGRVRVHIAGDANVAGLPELLEVARVGAGERL